MIASTTSEQHSADLAKVFYLLARHNLRITVKKCKFFKFSLTFLSYEVSSDGTRPTSDLVDTI